MVVDDAGAIEAIVASERNVAHRIIEEFMLLANETVAAHLEVLAEILHPTRFPCRHEGSGWIRAQSTG